jgi:hypothetical protein
MIMQTLDLPVAAGPTPPQAGLSLDPRLTQRGVEIQKAFANPGQVYWRLVSGRWFDMQEAGGRHHIYVEAVDTNGMPLAGKVFRVTWPTGEARQTTNGRFGFDAGNFPMSPSRNEFAVAMDDGSPSDVVLGIGTGADTPQGYNPGIHTSTILSFQRTIHTGSTPPTPTLPVPTPPTTPPGPTPPPNAPALLAEFDGKLAELYNLYRKALGV